MDQVLQPELEAPDFMLVIFIHYLCDFIDNM